MIGVATVNILNDLSRWDDRRALLVQGLQRVAQLVQVRVGGRPVMLVNGHYYWPARLHGARVRQVMRVLDAVKALDPGRSVIACGDFNATPGAGPALVTRGPLRLFTNHLGGSWRGPWITSSSLAPTFG